jgi:hypothetical protein
MSATDFNDYFLTEHENLHILQHDLNVKGSIKKPKYKHTKGFSFKKAFS